MNARSCSAIVRSAAVCIAAAALFAAPGAAQDHRFALGVGGGWSNHGDLTPGLSTTTTPEAGWLGTAQLELWPGSARTGLRLGGSYAVRALEEDPASSYMMLTSDLSLLVRLLPAGRGRWVAPYLALGAGAVGYLARDAAQPMGGVYGDDPVVRVLALGGGGVDLFPSARFGARVEAVDRVVLPGFGEGPESLGVPTAHGLEVTAALQLRGWRVSRQPAVVAAMPAPAAPAPAAQPAQPSAAEREAAELRARMQDWQGRLTSLSTRVDSLERALAAVRTSTVARPAVQGGPLGTPVASEARAMATAPEPDVFAAPGAVLYTVQVGAFVEEATAARWADRLRARNLPVWVTDAVVRGMRVRRVRVGALPTQDEADALARRLRTGYGWPTWVDRVSEAEVVPADAVAATRSFLRAN